jgi:hypothetical protein
MELVWVSLIGMVVFGGLFLVLCPEWWSTSLGTLKEKQPVAGEPSDTRAGEPAASRSVSTTRGQPRRNIAAP